MARGRELVEKARRVLTGAVTEANVQVAAPIHASDPKYEAERRGPIVKEWTEKTVAVMRNGRRKEKGYAYSRDRSGTVKRRLISCSKIK